MNESFTQYVGECTSDKLLVTIQTRSTTLDLYTLLILFEISRASALSSGQMLKMYQVCQQIAPIPPCLLPVAQKHFMPIADNPPEKAGKRSMIPCPISDKLMASDTGQSGMGHASGESSWQFTPRQRSTCQFQVVNDIHRPSIIPSSTLERQP